MSTHNTPYTPKPNTWTLFKNSKKTKEEQPDYTGTAMLEMPDGSAKEYRLSAWKRTTKAGAPFIGGFIKPSLPQTELIPAADGSPTEHEW
jgi:hypothetical protein